MVRCAGCRRYHRHLGVVSETSDSAIKEILDRRRVMERAPAQPAPEAMRPPPARPPPEDGDRFSPSFLRLRKRSVYAIRYSQSDERVWIGYQAAP